MRLNARLDDEANSNVEYLTQATGQSVSQVVREALARYRREVQPQRSTLRHFAQAIGNSGSSGNSGNSGSGDSGRSDLASNYKQIVGEIIETKLGLPRR